MLQLADITKEYPGPRGVLRILDRVSLTLERGQSAAIMGPSGSGKSTLLYVAGALEPPTSGSVTLDGIEPFSLDERRLAAFRNTHIGFVFQDHCLLPQCTVLENVLIPTLVSHDGREDASVRARGLITRVGLAERIDHRPAALSGGEKQRVAIARALIMNPGLLLCDEPTGNLDRRSADTVASLLLELHEQQRIILLVVTHSVELASRFQQRFELIDGQLSAASASH